MKIGRLPYAAIASQMYAPSEELDHIKVPLSRTLLEFDRILDIHTENILSFRVVMKKSETMGD